MKKNIPIRNSLSILILFIFICSILKTEGQSCEFIFPEYIVKTNTFAKICDSLDTLEKKYCKEAKLPYYHYVIEKVSKLECMYGLRTYMSYFYFDCRIIAFTGVFEYDGRTFYMDFGGHTGTFEIDSSDFVEQLDSNHLLKVKERINAKYDVVNEVFGLCFNYSNDTISFPPEPNLSK